MAIDICPACGYPTIGPEPCAVCRSIGALTGDKTFESMLSANEAASGIGTAVVHCCINARVAFALRCLRA